MASFMAVWPVVTFFLGGAAAWFRDWQTAKRQLARETEARDAARERAVLDRRESFELEHLGQLNDALQDLARAAGAAHWIDLRTSRETGVYAGTQLTEQASNDMLEANRRVHTLAGLVLDDGVRGLVERAHTEINKPARMHRAEVDAAERAFNRGVLAVDEAQSAIASRIRAIYLAPQIADQS